MKLCFGCMQEITDDKLICPSCGTYNDETMEEAYTLLPGTRVQGRYYIGKVFYKDKYEIWYRAYDCQKNKKVMVRELFPIDTVTRLYGDPALVFSTETQRQQYFEAIVEYMIEGKRMMNLSKCEQIVQVYDAFPDNNRAYIVTECLEGNSLDSVIKSLGTLSQEQANDFILQLLDGVKVIHDSGIIHGNLSPEKLWVTPKGKLIIMGLGNAQYAYSLKSEYVNGMFATGYAPYERYRGIDEQGKWTDLYSIGAIYYKMITGVTPEDSTDRSITDHLLMPSQMGIAIKPEIEAVLRNSLCINPKQRLQDTEVFKTALLQKDVKPKQVTYKKKNHKNNKQILLYSGFLCCFLGVVIAAAFGIKTIRKKPNEEKKVEVKEKKNHKKNEGTIETVSQQDPSNMSMEFGEEDKGTVLYGEVQFEINKKILGERNNTNTYQWNNEFEYSYEFMTVEKESFKPTGTYIEHELRSLNDGSYVEFTKNSIFQVYENGIYGNSGNDQIGNVDNGKGLIPVYVTISTGYVTVPNDLTGKTENSVKQKLEQQGFNVQRETEYNDMEKGLVYGSYPESGTKCKDKNITLFVSLGPKPQEEKVNHSGGTYNSTTTTSTTEQSMPDINVDISRSGY